MRERGPRHDVVDAVLAAGYDDMTDAVARADALERALGMPEFADVTGAFKRITNIAGKVNGAAAADDLTPETTRGAMEPAEAALWRAFTNSRSEAEDALAAEDYARFYRLVAGLKGPVDVFFARTLVMDPDPAPRRRRLAMLRAVAVLLARPADLGKLATG